MTMSIDEKLQVIRKAINYAEEGGLNCLNCVRDKHYPSLTYEGNEMHAIWIMWALDKCDIPLDAVDKITAEKGLVEGEGTNLSQRTLMNRKPELGGCIPPEEFMACIKELLYGLERGSSVKP